MEDRRVDAAIEALAHEDRDPFLVHVLGGTSAAWLADWLTRAGHPVTASEVVAYRERGREWGWL